VTDQPDQQPYETRRDQPGGYETRRDGPSHSYETRRDGPSHAYETRWDAPGAYETRRDQTGGYETRRDRQAHSYQTGRDGPPEQGSSWWAGARQDTTSLLSLPSELAARYTAVGELPNPGTEADVLKVVDPAGAELVVKLYRRGITAERTVWAKLDEISSPHVIRFVETGTAAGRDYECMEFLSGGNLTALVSAPGTPLPAMLVTDVVRQVADGLMALHSFNLLHRDLKPENILIRRRTPLELVVTDLGLARVLDRSVIAASRSGTQAYFPPELLVHGGGSQSRARDWWALGMIVRELLVGRRTFDEMLDGSIANSIALRDIDLSEVEDPRMRLLCRGLLTRDPEDRWGADQVGEWLAGGSPAVTDSRSAQDGASGLPFAGKTYTGRPQLARALAANWELAARRYFAMMGSHDSPSEGWRALRTWLGGFENLATGDLESRQELIDQWLLGSAPPDVKLVRLLRWLDPRQPPIYREFSVAPEHLSALAAAAAEPQSPAARVVGDLWRYDLLPILADFSGGEPLRDVHVHWHELYDEWTLVDAQLRPLLPSAAAAISGGAEQIALLGLAAEPAEEERALRERVTAGLAALPVRLEWMDQVVHRGGQSPLAAVTVLRLLPGATRESHELAQRTAATRAEWQARQRRWEEREQARQAGAGVAQTRALIPLVIWTVAMVTLALISISTAPHWVAGISFLCAAAAAALAFWSELGLVKELAGDYYPGYSIGSRIGPLFSRFRARGVGAAPGCLILFGVLMGISLIAYFPPVLFGTVGAWHYSTVVERRRVWRAVHQQEARSAGVSG